MKRIAKQVNGSTNSRISILSMASVAAIVSLTLLTAGCGKSTINAPDAGANPNPAVVNAGGNNTGGVTGNGVTGGGFVNGGNQAQVQNPADLPTTIDALNTVGTSYRAMPPIPSLERTPGHRSPMTVGVVTATAADVSETNPTSMPPVAPPAQPAQPIEEIDPLQQSTVACVNAQPTYSGDELQGTVSLDDASCPVSYSATYQRKAGLATAVPFRSPSAPRATNSSA